MLNIFPSVDTPTCAASVRSFNKHASSVANTVVLCISKDLPFAAKRFCAAEGLNNVETVSIANSVSSSESDCLLQGSTFRSNFGKDYGTGIAEGHPMVPASSVRSLL